MTTGKQLSYSLKTLVTGWGRQASFYEEGTFELREGESFPGKVFRWGKRGIKTRKSTVHPGKSLQGQRVESGRKWWEPTGICEHSGRSFPISYLMCSKKHWEDRNQKHRRIAMEMKVDTQVHWSVKCLRGQAVEFTSRKGGRSCLEQERSQKAQGSLCRSSDFIYWAPQI